MATNVRVSFAALIWIGLGPMTVGASAETV
jgi:hypothetical protein